jgi:hypothetical protein
MNTDIEILGTELDSLLQKCIQNYSKTKIKKQYLTHLSLLIEMISNFNF